MAGLVGPVKIGRGQPVPARNCGCCRKSTLCDLRYQLALGTGLAEVNPPCLEDALRTRMNRVIQASTCSVTSRIPSGLAPSLAF